jgi:prephenate dehydrogenase
MHNRLPESHHAVSVDWSTVAIVGVGLIGGSLALGLKRAGLTDRVVGVSSERTIREARELGVIDDGSGYDEIADAVSKARVVFLCTPIHRIIELLPVVMRSVPSGAVVSDVGSTKAEIVRAAATVTRPDAVFIGGHPMAGSEQSGVGAADPFLFQNAMYVLTPTADTPSPLVASFGDGLARLGARVISLAPDVHDRVAAGVSHLPQLIALSLVEFVGKRNEEEPAHLRMAAGGFRDMTRIASSPFRMWRDILQTNSEEIRHAIGDFRKYLDGVEDDLDDASGHFENANEIRGTIPRDAKGFISPLSDVLVRVEDRPGMLARMTTAIADAGISIMDIELLKIREGEGGTFRLAFHDSETAARAVDILCRTGFSARVR